MRPITALSPLPMLRRTWLPVVLFAVAALALWAPHQTGEAAMFVAVSLFEVAPMLVPGIVLAAWLTASGAGGPVSRAFEGRTVVAVLAASAIGAVTPVCGITVLPMMVGLLGAGVPLAPVMAFWLSSPITDPAMLAATMATLGLDFAVGKTVAAFGLGLAGGAVTAALARRAWITAPLRGNALVAGIARPACGPTGFAPQVWRRREDRARFGREMLSLTRLVLICLVPAFAAEHLLNELLRPDALAAYAGAENWWAVPLAVFVGAPAYVDGYAALPLTRALLDHGLAPGAAIAFLVSGGVVSIWGALAIAPVLKLQPFVLYLAVAVAGSLATGWLFGAVA
ncbi:MAG: permease [Alphaproteobacteria bacterium]